MRRRLILLSLAAAAAWPAFAAGKKDEEAEGERAPYVDLDPVGLPVIFDGRLVNYVFTQVRVNLTPGADAPTLRAREPYFRDALVKAAYRTPFVVPGDGNRLDAAKLGRAMAVEAARIAGPGAIASVSVIAQAPKQRVSLR